MTHGKNTSIGRSKIKNAKKNQSLLKETLRAPFNGLGKPEPLKGNLTGFWSRRIDDSNRLIYAVEEMSIFIISCRGHYDS